MARIEPLDRTHTRPCTRIALACQGTATDPEVAAMVAFGQQVIAAPAGIHPSTTVKSAA